MITLEHEVVDLKKQLDAANANVKVLTDKATESVELMKKATDALNEYMAAEKKALLESIIAKSEFKADELKDRNVADLRIVSLAIDKAKPAPTGTVKNVRGAGDSASTRLNVMADGRIDPTISIMGHPERQADGSVKWVN
jgi:hypothetical protein